MNSPYKLQIGRFTGYVLDDLTEPRTRVPSDMFLGLTPELQTEKGIADTVPWALNIFYFSDGNENILFDTGQGRYGEGVGAISDGLQQIGVSPEDITLIIISHAHGDHIGGLTNEDGSLKYPNARYVIMQEEWDYWTTDEQLNNNQLLKDNLLPIKDKVSFVKDGEEIIDGVKAVLMNGHTIGHMALEIESEGDKIIHIADGMHSYFQIEHPEFTIKFDSDPELAIKNRPDVLKYLANSSVNILTYHFGFPGIGRVISTNEGYMWQED